MSERREKPISIGVIGLGRSGWGIHCLHLADNPDYNLVAVVDPLEERREEALEKLGVQRAYADPDELFADDEVELIVVATPSHTHKELGLKALKAGKHVMIEKPFAVSAEEADELIQEARTRDRIVTCFQSRRLDPDFLKVQQLIDEGRIGRVFYIRNGRYQFQRRRDWQTLTKMGGGMLFNWGAHLIDQGLLLIDGKVREFFCDLKRTVSAGDAEDHVKVCLKGENGMVVDVEIFSACPVPMPDWTVLGDRGMIQGGRSKLKVQWFEEGALPPIEADPGAAEGRSYGGREDIPWKHEEIELSQDHNEQLREFYSRLYKSLRQGEPLFVTPESVRDQLALLDRCRESYRVDVEREMAG